MHLNPIKRQSGWPSILHRNYQTHTWAPLLIRRTIRRVSMAIVMEKKLIDHLNSQASMLSSKQERSPESHLEAHRDRKAGDVIALVKNQTHQSVACACLCRTTNQSSSTNHNDSKLTSKRTLLTYWRTLTTTIDQVREAHNYTQSPILTHIEKGKAARILTSRSFKIKMMTSY